MSAFAALKKSAETGEPVTVCMTPGGAHMLEILARVYGHEHVEVTVDISLKMQPAPGTAPPSSKLQALAGRWMHASGKGPYRVLHVADDAPDNTEEPTVVYQGPDGAVWTRKESNFYARMTKISE
jgi:hypothetical protein